MSAPRLTLAALSLLAALSAGAQSPPPVVHYTLRVDPADFTGWSVAMRIRSAPDSFQLAMARHSEYDDRYWRYVQGVGIEGARPGARIVGTDSALWTVHAPGGEATVRYRVALPTPEPNGRASWRPFLSETGGLTGGIHAFMYVRGATDAPSHVALDVPAGWEVATELRRTGDARVFHAADVQALVEAPILTGRLRDWRFLVDGVPHRVAYWPLPNAQAFDTVAFVDGLARLSRQAMTLFGRAPFPEYVFLIQDGAYGGLEHPASVVLGTRSADLAESPLAGIEDAAHEYLHAWNLMRIRPREWLGVSHRAPALAAGLWFSEGLTMYYADALLRRAGLPTEHPTREAHLAYYIQGYLESPGESRFSAERVSRVAYDGARTGLGDYDASTHRQGELIGTMLDFIVRDATRGAQSMDDVMRLMLVRSAAGTGFGGRDVERAVEDVCRCDVTPFFDAHVRSGSPIDFARYLRLAGLRLEATWAPATRDGVAAPDTRVAGWETEGEPGLRLRVYQPEGVWARAGLHTGDRVVSMNGAPVATWREMRTLLARQRIGDTVRVVVSRGVQTFQAAVALAGYERPSVRVLAAENASAVQVGIRGRWSSGW